MDDIIKQSSFNTSCCAYLFDSWFLLSVKRMQKKLLFADDTNFHLSWYVVLNAMTLLRQY